MAQGLIPYRRKHYKVLHQVGNGDIKIVTPTEAVVQRAKMDAKRKLKEAAVYKPKRARLQSQSGAGGKKRRIKKTKKSGATVKRGKKPIKKKAPKKKSSKRRKKSKK